MNAPRVPTATRVLRGGLRWAPLIGLLLLAVLPGVAADRFVHLAILVAINVLLGQSLNLLTGYAGEMSIGHAALYGSSAYCAAYLELQAGWPILLSAPVAVAFAVILGALVSIPAARVREFYLAMVSLGLGMLGTEVMRQWSSVTGGFSGLTGIPSVTLMSLEFFGMPIGLTAYYVVSLVIVGVAMWMLLNVIQSHIGRSLVLISVNETVAGALGICAARAKRFAYMFSAGLAGLAGVLYAHLVGYLSPDAFSVNVSIAILVFPILGGMRTLWGPVLGAACLTLLPDQLQSFGSHQVLIYGAILLFSYVALPNGLVGLARRRTSMIATGHRGDSTPSAQSARGPGAARASPSFELSGAGNVRAFKQGHERPVVLQVERADKSFGGVQALDEVSLKVVRGSIHGLIGPNGSGKTTLLNVISGVLPADSGGVRILDHDTTRLPSYEIARLGVARTYQHPMLVPTLTVLENVVIGAERRYRTGALGCALRVPACREEEEAALASALNVIDALGLGAWRDTPVGELPFGRQRMVELARALCLQPALMMLDEPAAGLAAADIREMATLLRHMRDGGTTIVIVEHHMDFLLRLVDTVTVLDEGSVIYQGSPAGLARDRRVVEAYLGTSAAQANAAA